MKGGARLGNYASAMMGDKVTCIVTVREMSPKKIRSASTSSSGSTGHDLSFTFRHSGPSGPAITYIVSYLHSALLT